MKNLNQGSRSLQTTTFFIFLFSFFICSCDLFNASTDKDYLRKIDEEIAYSNAPWVPVFIQTGGMGIADPTGPQPQLAKLAPLNDPLYITYSFSLYFQPAREYPFTGWQAWVEGEGLWATWELQEWEKDNDNYIGSDTERVKFVPQNNDGTVVEIFIYEMPTNDRQLYIGPLGADLNEQAIRVMADPRWGTVFTESMVERKPGFPFTVEFAVSGDWEFMGWRAYTYTGQNADNLTLEELGEELSEKDVDIVETGIGRADVTVNTDEQVLLVPLCLTPVRVLRSTPSQYVTLEYGFAQNIEITFSTQLEPSTVKFGKGHIEISELSGTDITDRYTLYYDDNVRLVTITPTQLLTNKTTVTVTLGTGIMGTDGNRLNTQPIVFDVSEEGIVERSVYAASNIWALHDPAQYMSEFFSQWEDRHISRDKRIRKNANGKYEVTLYFGVQAKGEIDNNIVHDIEIVEIHYANLNGNPVSDEVGVFIASGNRVSLDIGEMEETDAGLAYQNANPDAGKYYQAVYRWDKPVQGIIRLAVLPYSGTVEKENWETVVAKGESYITVVFDNLAPGGTETAVFSGEATQSQSETGAIYNYNSDKNTMTVNLNFRNIRDNFNGEFIDGNLNASGSKPRTMDPQSAIEWQLRIATGKAAPDEWYYPTLPAPVANGWAALLNDSSESVRLVTADLAGIINDAITTRKVQVSYRDSFGWTSDWQDVGSVRYYNVSAADVSTWTGDYEKDTNSIKLTWTLPENMEGVEVSVNGSIPIDYKAEDDHTHIHVNVPRINELGIRSGQQISNVSEYTVSLRAYNEFYRQEEATVFKIWNIPDMSVESTANAPHYSNTVLLDNSLTQTKLHNLLTSNLTGVTNFVLTSDIVLDSATWAPVDLSSHIFYGNGHTITINAGTSTNYRGIFANVNNAKIRDLRVHYAGNVTATGFTANPIYIGGLVAHAQGATKIRNIIVSGGENITLTANTSNDTYMGGIAGYIGDDPAIEGDGTAIENCYSDLNVKLSGTGNNTLNIGGIVGRFGLIRPSNNAINAPNNINLSGITVKGNVEATGPYIVIVGGLAGTTRTGGTIKDVSASGTVALKDSAYNNDSNYGLNVAVCGGIIGHLYDAKLYDIYFDGLLDFSNDEIPSSQLDYLGRSYIGGLVGNCGGAFSGTNSNNGQNYGEIIIERCFVRGDIEVIDYTTQSHYFGGVSGWTVGYNITGVTIIEKMVKFKDCAFEGNITITKEQGLFDIHIGGFAGNVLAAVSFENCRVLASSMTVSTTGGDVGGFAGLIRGNINGCYTNFPMEIKLSSNSEANDDCHVGGLIGRFDSNVPSQNYVVSECYSGSSVTVSGEGRYVHAGGLIGRLGGEQSLDIPQKFQGNVSLRNSYATGNVFASSTNATPGSPPPYFMAEPFVYAGGLVGSMEIYSDFGLPPRTRAVENCFATGSVTAQSSNSSATVYAGGLVGNRINGPINNCAVLGSYVLAKRGTSLPTLSGTFYLGRITGNLAGSPTLSNNYAADTMLLRRAAYATTTTFTSVDILNNVNSMDGQSTTAIVFCSPFFWTGTETNNLRFDDNIWRTNQVVSEGHPRLANVGGQ